MAVIFQNIKGLSTENAEVLFREYGDLETSSARFIAGDPLWDYNPQNFWVYPEDLQRVIKNHKLKIIEQKVYVDKFYSNLYISEYGYYVTISEFNQKDLRGVNSLGIGDANVFKTLDEVRAVQQNYENEKARTWESEHFYTKISDQHGIQFPAQIHSMIDTMCKVLNIDRKILSFDSIGIKMVDQAIHWNHDKYLLFEKWYPGALAFYGECYMRMKGDGKWVVRKDRQENGPDVLIPHLLLSDGDDVFDSNDFYKTLMEWPIPLKEAGDWNGHWRAYKREQKNIK